MRMGSQVSRTDFEWCYSPEPHSSRRKEILAKYPQVQKLFGHDPNLKWQILTLVAINLSIAFFVVPHLSGLMIFILAYLIGGTINHSLFLGMHEIAHNLAFGHKHLLANRILGFIANLPTIVPMSVSFRKYHLDHHKYQGDDYLDTDIPSYFEAKLVTSQFRKFIWILLQPLMYAGRPLMLVYKPVSLLEVINTTVQLTFDIFVVYFFGWKPVIFLFGGECLAMGLHPVAGHFISEHYCFMKGIETYSYYGPLNWLCFNVGYHNEHHDFPNIPGSRLPQLKALAPDFYDNLPCHTSWVKVLYDFITCEEMGPYARIKRPSKFIKSKSKHLSPEQVEKMD